MTGTNQPPLALAAWQFNPDSPPFHDDQLNRQRYATRLTDFVGRLGAGGVIAVDAPWGSGKTWFGRNWAAQLHAGGHKVAFIDAFEQDYVEDPFMVIAAELATLLDDNKGGASLLRGKAAAVMKAILPLGSRLLVNAVGRFALGSADLADDIQEAVDAAREGVADRAEKSIEKKLEEHEDEKRSFAEYRRELAAFAVQQEKPVVVFVDELDRCNPMFAVRLVERIKHFFDIPNVVFVLLLNRVQLEQAVKGMFGRETDAAAYLSKFVRFFFRLPAPSADRNSQFRSQASDFLVNELSRYGFIAQQNRAVEHFQQAGLVWVHAARLSLRDMEKMCALFALSGPNGAAGLLAYLIALKLRAPSICDGLLREDQRAHRTAAEWIGDCIGGADFEEDTIQAKYLAALQELHLSLAGFGPEEYQHLNGPVADWILGDVRRSDKRALMGTLARIDLSLEM